MTDELGHVGGVHGLGDRRSFPDVRGEGVDDAPRAPFDTTIGVPPALPRQVGGGDEGEEAGEFLGGQEISDAPPPSTGGVERGPAVPGTLEGKPRDREFVEASASHGYTW
ncbi:hypothetical protein [Embleya sp. NPDC020886]|uniref:hypothetical protein n=1 Tax=Embleya sp. NPDC020886 TaxID=3363980 RepID=UPI0037A0DDFC